MGVPLGVFRSVLCLLGLCLSAYALYVETLKHGDSSYTPLCDVSESISCSRAFLSKYGKGFGLIGSLLGEDSILNLPNAVFGIIFYPSVSLIGMLQYYTRYCY
jgi:vitamin-K-epoxide reductase (warfarin-sensitive)